MTFYKLLYSLKIYRRLVGGKWARIDGQWWPARTWGGLQDFIDADTSMVHYTYNGIERREDYTVKPVAETSREPVPRLMTSFSPDSEDVLEVWLDGRLIACFAHEDIGTAGFAAVEKLAKRIQERL